jgi:hypothetical protein
VVEVTLVAITVGFRPARPTAVLAVLGYRLVNYGLPLLPGAVAYLQLRLKQRWIYRTTGAWCRFLGACPAGNLGREKSPGLRKARDDQ